VILRQQIEDLEGRLVAELEMGLHQKAALQRVDLAVQQVKHENELLQQQLDESTLAEVRCTQFTCFVTRRPHTPMCVCVCVCVCVYIIPYAGTRGGAGACDGERDRR
jgi:hypothetical protein